MLWLGQRRMGGAGRPAYSRRKQPPYPAEFARIGEVCDHKAEKPAYSEDVSC